jgi:PAS domain S-box-containing protein
MLMQASFAVQIAFSCLLVSLLEFYYRRAAREAWLRWFAWIWVAQACYVLVLWGVLDNPSGGLLLRAVTAILGYLVPPTIALTGIALWRGRQPSRAWIAGLFGLGLAAAAVTFAAGHSYPVDSRVVWHVHNVPRNVFFTLASLFAALIFAIHGHKRKLAGSMITAAAWVLYAAMNLSRAWQWYATPGLALSGADNNPTLIRFAVVTFVLNSLVWIMMCIGVGLLLTESAERSERRAREALRELEATQAERSRLARLVERSRDAILVVSAGQLRYLNTAAACLLGYTPDQIPSLLVKPVREVCGTRPEDPMCTRMEAGIAAVGQWEGQSEWSNCATGEWLPMLVGAVAMEAREGEPPSIGLIGRDLRERLRLEEDLRQAQRQEALGRMAGGIAHDFNNLLTVIMGFSSLALQENLGERLRDNIEEVLAAARRAAAITDRLRAFGRRQALNATVFDLNAMVDSMRGGLEKLVAGKVQLSYELCEAPLPVHADAAQIEQVLMNLVLNARQSIDGPGRVIVRTARAAPEEAPKGHRREFVKIEIQDTGSGIEPGVLEHIFDPYFTTRSAGSGLGLSMAYGIVKQSEGHMNVTSQPGQGSVFAVLLPAASIPESPARGAPAQPDARAAQGREVVMIVDDRQDVMAFVAACLERYGYRTVAFTDSESALASVRDGSFRVQLVIRDVMMPGMPLQEFAARVREFVPGVPIVFMSGLPEPSIAPLIEGMSGYFIPKPFLPEQLAALVRRALDGAAILTS